MNGKLAKRVRRLIYADSPYRVRYYQKLPNGQIIADEQRRVYQGAKVLAREEKI